MCEFLATGGTYSGRSYKTSLYSVESTLHCRLSGSTLEIPSSWASSSVSNLGPFGAIDDIAFLLATIGESCRIVQSEIQNKEVQRTTRTHCGPIVLAKVYIHRRF